jgi:hypothetical protein
MVFQGLARSHPEVQARARGENLNAGSGSRAVSAPACSPDYRLRNRLYRSEASPLRWSAEHRLNAASHDGDGGRGGVIGVIALTVPFHALFLPPLVPEGVNGAAWCRRQNVRCKEIDASNGQSRTHRVAENHPIKGVQCGLRRVCAGRRRASCPLRAGPGGAAPGDTIVLPRRVIM